MVVTTIQKKLTLVNFKKGGNKKEYIVVHDVGVKGQTAKNNIDYFYNKYRGASAHYFVDRNSIWQSVDDNDIAWHIGDGKGKYGIYNADGIGIEMIVEKDGTIHKETKENTKWLVNMLQKKYGVPDTKIIRHYDASRKNCPQFLNKDGKWTEWKQFYSYLISDEKKDGELTVSQYNELLKRIQSLETQLKEEREKQAGTVSSWAKESMDWGKKIGLTDGTSPKSHATREQVVAMIRNYDKAKGLK